MRASITVLLVAFGTISHAADKILLSDFLDDIRHQLYNIGNAGNERPVPMTVKSIHVEMNVIAEKDQQGNTVFYVIEGMANKKDLITQKLSFDVEIPTDAAAGLNQHGNRTYSTRSLFYQYGTDRYRPYRRRHDPYYNDRYFPDISPVILYNQKR